MRDTSGADSGATRTTVRGQSLFWVVTLGALLGAFFALRIAPPEGERFEARLKWPHAMPTESDWPRAKQAGETVRLEPGPAGHTLIVTAGSAADARALLREFAGRHAPDGEHLGKRLEQVMAKWNHSLPTGPQPTLANEADLAAWLMARARWGRILASELPVPDAGTVAPIHEPDPVLDAWEAIVTVVEARQTAAISRAFEQAHEEEQRWFRDPGAWTGYSIAARAEAWRQWQLMRAVELDDQARVILLDVSPLQQRLVRSVADEHLLDLGARLTEPWAAFASPSTRSLRPLVRPIFSAWWPPLAVGSGAGALLAMLVLLLTSMGRSVPDDRLFNSGFLETLPSDAGPTLHVVCGVNRTAVTRAALELAAHRLAAGERVLLVDGSAKLALHERLGRDARWGLLECLAADMPVLGLIQYAGHPGLYLLPHGNAERLVGWSPLGRKMDEVVPHFGRIILLLDPKSPDSVGDALRGRAMEGWWAMAGGRSGRALDDATAKFGIVFQEITLASNHEVSLEVLAERVRSLRPNGPVRELAPITAPALPAKREPVRTLLEPIVLDCDLQVRQRLRFLAWTRRVQAESRRAALQPTS